MNLIFGWLISCVLLSLPANPPKESLRPVLSTSVGGNQPTDLLHEREAIFEATNQQRVRKRLTPTRKDSRLMLAAQRYADLMAAQDQMSHTIGGITLTQKANRVGYAYRQLSENIALNSRLVGSFVVDEQWMKSKEHRKNLLTSTSTDIGIDLFQSKELLIQPLFYTYQNKGQIQGAKFQACKLRETYN